MHDDDCPGCGACVRMLGDKVMIERYEIEDTTPSGIIKVAAQTGKRWSRTAFVVGVGPDVSTLHIGNRVLVDVHVGEANRLHLGTRTFEVLAEDDEHILAVIEPD